MQRFGAEVGCVLAVVIVGATGLVTMTMAWTTLVLASVIVRKSWMLLAMTTMMQLAMIMRRRRRRRRIIATAITKFWVWTSAHERLTCKPLL